MIRRAAPAVGFLALANTGCAFMFKGSSQTVHVRAIPEGADIKSSGRYLGPAPSDVEVARGKPANLQVSKEGYEPTHVQLTKHSDIPWMLWDFATCVVPVTLCIPVLVDAISGAWNSYDDSYAVKLDAKAAPAPAGVAPTARPFASPRPPAAHVAQPTDDDDDMMRTP